MDSNPRSNIQCGVPESATPFLIESGPFSATDLICAACTSGRPPPLMILSPVMAQVEWYASRTAYLGGTHAPTREDKKSDLFFFDEGFRVLAMTPRYRILGTRHGVVAVDVGTDRYAWLYVFPGGHKLRWKSIDSAVFDGENVTITFHALEPAGLPVPPRESCNVAAMTALKSLPSMAAILADDFGKVFPDLGRNFRPFFGNDILLSLV